MEQTQNSQTTQPSVPPQTQAQSSPQVTTPPTSPTNSNTNLMAGIAMIVLIAVGVTAYVMYNKDTTRQEPIPQEQPQTTNQTTNIQNNSTITFPTSSDTMPPSTSESEMAQPTAMMNAKTFTVEAEEFSFSAKEIRVKKGDVVTINFVNKEGMHDWVLDEFAAKTKQIGANQTDTVTFVASQVGTFEYYCSVGQHRQMGMKGNLIVEE